MAKYVDEVAMQAIIDKTKESMATKVAKNGATMTGEIKMPTIELGSNALGNVNNILEIGNGADESNKSNAFTVDKDGNMTVGGTVKIGTGMTLAELNAKVGSGYSAKGTINFTDLPTPSASNVGFVYNVKNTTGTAAPTDDITLDSITITDTDVADGLANVKFPDQLNIPVGYTLTMPFRLVSDQYRFQINRYVEAPNDTVGNNGGSVVVVQTGTRSSSDGTHVELEFRGKYGASGISFTEDDVRIKSYNITDEPLNGPVTLVYEVKIYNTSSASTGISRIFRIPVVLNRGSEVEDSFTIDNRFVDYEAGKTKKYPSGTNVAIVEGDGEVVDPSTTYTKDIHFTSDNIKNHDTINVTLPQIATTQSIKFILHYDYDTEGGDKYFYMSQLFGMYTVTGDYGDVNPSTYGNDYYTCTKEAVEGTSNKPTVAAFTISPNDKQLSEKKAGSMDVTSYVGIFDSTIEPTSNKAYLQFTVNYSDEPVSNYKFDVLPGFIDQEMVTNAMEPIGADGIDAMWG